MLGVTVGATLMGMLSVATMEAPVGAVEAWQDEVHLRPTSVEALLSVETASDHGPVRDVDDDRFVDPDKYVMVTVAHAPPGGQCAGAGDVYVTMTGTRRDGGQDTLVAQCESSTVDAAEARLAASARVRERRDSSFRPQASTRRCEASLGCGLGCTWRCPTSVWSPRR